MNLIKLSIERPIAIVAMVLMILLFGYVAMQRIPIQMAPDVRQPVIIVKTSWPGAAPQEIEREIINPPGRRAQRPGRRQENDRQRPAEPRRNHAGIPGPR